MINEKLLETIARELYDETGRALTLAEGAVYFPLIEWQMERTGKSLFQYPEPFNGAVSGSCTVLFLGLNPGYKAGEDIPSFGVSFEDYHDFYKTRLHEIRKDGSPARRMTGGSLESISAYRKIEGGYLSGIASPAGPLKLGDNCMYADVVPFKSSKWNSADGARATLKKSGRWRDVVTACNRRIERLVRATGPTLTVVQGGNSKDLFPELAQLKMSDAPILSVRRGGVDFTIQWLYHSAAYQVATPEYYSAASVKAQAFLSEHFR